MGAMQSELHLHEVELQLKRIVLVERLTEELASKEKNGVLNDILRL